MYESLKDIEREFNIKNLSKKYEAETIEIFNGGNIDSEDPEINNIIGLYHKHITKDYDLMKKYFLMAIERGESNSMNNLGHYYCDIEQNYDLMKKYYLMAIERGDLTSASSLGYYYQLIEQN